jgi:hypothetical protein
MRDGVRLKLGAEEFCFSSEASCVTFRKKYGGPMKNTAGISLAHIFGLLLLSGTAFAADPVFDAAAKIAGKYSGHWALYGVADGKVVEKASWTDTLTATNPTRAAGKAYVDVTDLMTFPDGTTRTSTFQEGYLESADGSVGERFYDIHGQKTLFRKLTDNDWSYQSGVDAGELWFLGFNPKTVVTASHVAVKSTTLEGNVDTDHVTRVTTIQWRDVDGSLKSVQFVSMKGEHTRVAE